MTIIGFTMWKTLGLYRLSYSAGLLQASVVQILVRNGELSYKRSTAISSYIPNTIFCRLSAILVLLSSNYHSCMNWDRISVLLVFNTITMAMDIISVAGGEQVGPYPSSTSPSLTIILENCFTKCIHLYSVGVGLPWLPGNRFSRWYTPRISAIILCHIILDLHSVYPMANNPEVHQRTWPPSFLPMWRVISGLHWMTLGLLGEKEERIELRILTTQSLSGYWKFRNVSRVMTKSWR